jgi:hypothetical protein
MVYWAHLWKEQQHVAMLEGGASSQIGYVEAIKSVCCSNLKIRTKKEEENPNEESAV